MALSVPETIRVLLPNGAVKKLPLEEYVRGVVSATLPADSPLEAMKAQAVAARTFGAGTRRHIERGADVCTLRHCQVWKEASSPVAGRAAGATRGIVAVHNGRLIDAYYFEHCDGNTRDAAGILIQAAPYLHGVACACGFATLKGHGIGMCQRGALVMARFGETFEVILKHYYTGIVLERVGVMPTVSTPATVPLASRRTPDVAQAKSRGTAATERHAADGDRGRGIGEGDAKSISHGEAEAAAGTPRSGVAEEAERKVEPAEQPTETPVVHLPAPAEQEAPPPAHVPEPTPAQTMELAPPPVEHAPPVHAVEFLPAQVEEPPLVQAAEPIPVPVEEAPPAPLVELPPTPTAEPAPAPEAQVRMRKSKAPKRTAKTKKGAGTSKSRRSKKATGTQSRGQHRQREPGEKGPTPLVAPPAAPEEAAAGGQVAETPEAATTDGMKSVLPTPPEEDSAVALPPSGVVVPPPLPNAAPAPDEASVVQVPPVPAPAEIEVEDRSTGEFSWYPVAEEVALESARFEAEMIEEVLEASTATITAEIEPSAIVPETPRFPESDVAAALGMEQAPGAPAAEVVKPPSPPETMPEEIPSSQAANVPVEVPIPLPPPFLEEELGQAPSTVLVPEVLIDHLPGPRMIAGDLSKPGIIITIRDAEGHAVVTVSGAAPHHGSGGFEAPLAGDGTYDVSFNHHALQVKLQDETVFICYTG